MGTWNSPAQVPQPPTFQYGTPSGDEQLRTFYEYVKKIANVVSALRNDLEFTINGKIDSENIREIAGYNVDKTVLKHKSGIVGMNGANPQDPNAIRFWAGNADPTQAPFRVQQNGTMHATDGNFTGKITGSTITGSKIQTSANSYPRIELTSTDQLLAAYRIATDFIKFHAQFTGSPTIEFDNGSANAVLSATGNLMIFNSLLGDLQIRAQNGYVRFQNWSNIWSNGNSQTLQDALTNIGSSGGASTIINQNLTPNRAVVSDSGGKVTAGPATTTEVSYLSGVTSNIQSQINSKANKSFPGWTSPSFQNGWTNGTYAAGYYKNDMSIVRLKGTIKSGTMGAAAFNLPSGYRPENDRIIATASFSGSSVLNTRVAIRVNGDVQIHDGSNNEVYLDNLTFLAEQ